MKKVIKTIACSVLSVVLMFSSAVPVMAAPNSEGSQASDYSKESNMTAHSDFIEESKSYSVDVYASQASGSDYYDENGDLVEGDIIVWLPTTATLEKNPDSDSGEYSCNVPVSVQGNIAGNEYISVVPDKTVIMKQDGKPDVTATITQEKTEFTYQDLKDGNKATTTTKISTNRLTAGDWVGVYSYQVSLKTR